MGKSLIIKNADFSKNSYFCEFVDISNTVEFINNARILAKTPNQYNHSTVFSIATKNISEYSKIKFIVQVYTKLPKSDYVDNNGNSPYGVIFNSDDEIVHIIYARIDENAITYSYDTRILEIQDDFYKLWLMYPTNPEVDYYPPFKLEKI